jgi:hypothetical protein
MFMERTNIKGAWADKTASDLERVRTLLLEQPEGAGGLPSAPAAASTSSSEASGAAPKQAPLKPPAPRRAASRPTVPPSPASAAP